MFLPSLKAGDVAMVAAVSSEQSSAKRLADLGFVRGTRLEMVRPGNPCIIRIDETCVALGAGLQESIRLKLV